MLEGGWTVLDKIDRPYSSSGGNFSVGYRVHHKDGTEAFLKAIDLSRTHSGAKFSPALLEKMIVAYNFECDLLRTCGNVGMSRVVRALTEGSIYVEGSELPVLYLIFELADGDVRHHVAASGQFDLAWKLRSLHDVAVGLSQLHRNEISHQDVKPSNVLVFERERSKVGDLGSAEHRGHTAPLIVSDSFAGDPDYAPPECLYGVPSLAGSHRARARDLYLFGSLILFFFVETNTTPAMLVKLPPAHHPRRGGTSFETALPHLAEAFDQVCEALARVPGVSDLLLESYRELCHPDPRLRGHAGAGRHSDRYALHRYITRLDLLEKRARFDPLAMSA